MSYVEWHISCSVTRWASNDVTLDVMALARCVGVTWQSALLRPNWSQALKSHTRKRSEAADAADGWPTSSTRASATRTAQRFLPRTDIPAPSGSAVAAGGDRDAGRPMADGQVVAHSAPAI